MKKTILYGMIAATALTITSCDKESENSYTSTNLIPAYNLFTSADSNEAPFVGLGAYNFTLKVPDNTFEMNVSSMPAPGGTTASFATKAISFISGYITFENKAYEQIKFSSNLPTATGTEISDLNVLLTQAVYRAPEGTGLQDYTPFVPSKTMHYAFMQYKYTDDWSVRTFWPDVTFRGTTTTTYPGMEGPFVNKTMSYRVVMQRKENAITNKADVIFYNARFAPKAPEILVVLKNLDLKFTQRGYEISGQDVIPYMLEGEGLTETPRYKFNAFTLTVGGDMTTASVSYRVAEVFKGEFQGSCVIAAEGK